MTTVWVCAEVFICQTKYCDLVSVKKEVFFIKKKRTKEIKGMEETLTAL